MNAADPRVVWQFEPEWRGRLLDDRGVLPLQQWLDRGQAQVIKQAAHRTVYRVQLAEADFFLKEYRRVGLRGFLRELLRNIKGQSEHRKAQLLAQKQIAAPRALGWGYLGPAFAPRASFVLTQTVTDAKPLTEAVPLNPLGRQQFAKSLGKFLARLHAAGVVHRDLHAGNLMVQSALEFVLLDLHEVSIGGPLPWSQRSQNLATLNRYFALAATRSDRLRFWRAYVAETKLPDAPTATPKAIERATGQSNLALWQQREQKYIHDGRVVHRVATGALTGWSVHDCTAFESLAAAPEHGIAGPAATRLKSGGASTIVLTPYGVLKRFNIRSWLDTWKNRLRRSPALRSWILAHGLRDAGLPTPRPLLWFRDRSSGTEYLLTEYLADAVDLRAFVEQELCVSALRMRIDALARVLRQFHERHFGHRDLKAANCLTPADSDDHRIWFIDLVGVGRRSTIRRGERVRDLARLAASFWRHPGVSNGDRLRFLRTYMDWPLHGKWGWKRWWREIREVTQAKVDRTQRRGRPLG